MIDPLLYETGVTVELIKEKVSYVMNIDVNQMIVPDRYPLARKRESVTARQISMKLSKEYTTASLSAIGNAHGGRDHATVLYSCKSVVNMIDTHDPLITIPYLRSKKLIDTFIEQQNEMRNNTQYLTQKNKWQILYGDLTSWHARKRLRRITIKVLLSNSLSRQQDVMQSIH